jgi:predicted DNA-binding ArsR family transcriptional regulator
MFESSDQELLEDIKDLLVDLKDQDFSVMVFKREYHCDDGSIEWDIAVSIYKEKNYRDLSVEFEDIRKSFNNGLFDYSEISFYVERLVNFMKDYNYSLRNDLNKLELNTRFVSQMARTSLNLKFKKNNEIHKKL